MRQKVLPDSSDSRLAEEYQEVGYIAGAEGQRIIVQKKLARQMRTTY